MFILMLIFSKEVMYSNLFSKTLNLLNFIFYFVTSFAKLGEGDGGVLRTKVRFTLVVPNIWVARVLMGHVIYLDLLYFLISFNISDL